MNKKIRIGLVGCGRISAKHLEALAKLTSEAELVAVCDNDQTKAEHTASQIGCKAYNNLEVFANSGSLDVVTLATPNGLHAEQTKFFASKGISVISEKPMAINWEDGVSAYEACKKNNVKHFIIHQNRFNDTIQHVWKALQEDRFGKIYMITSNVFWQRPQDYFDKDATWHGTKSIDGGAFMTQASHYVDMVQWLAQSEPDSVYSVLDTLGRDIETEDTGSAIIRFKNRIIASINMTILTYPQNMEGSITIMGEKGTVRISGVAMNRIEHWEFADSKPEDQEIINAGYQTASVYGFGHERNYKDIFMDLRGEKRALIDGAEGLKSLKLLCAILESNVQKKPVEF